MANCFRCLPFLDTGYPPGSVWPPGWGGVPNVTGLWIFSVAPNSAVCASPAITCTATGQEFTATTEILMDGTTPLSVANGRATYVSPTSMTISVNPVPETTPRTAQLTCRDTPGVGAGKGSVPFNFTAAPILTVVCPLVPASALLNVATSTTITGTLFTATCVVIVDGGAPITPTSWTATTIVFQMPASATAKTSQVTVRDTATSTTATVSCPFVYSATPLLTVTCPVNPATVVAGSVPSQVITVTGTNFTATTIATADNVDQTTTFGSATSISFTYPIPATVPTTQTVQVGARDGTAVAVTKCPFTITPTVALLPIVTCPVSPISAQVGYPALTLTVTGQNFTPTALITIDGITQATTFVSATSLTCQVNPVPETVRTVAIGVRDTAGPAVMTCPFDFTRAVPPVLTKVWPDMVGHWDDGKVITYTGTGFDSTSTVMFSGNALATTFVSATTLTTTTKAGTMTGGGASVRNGYPGGYALSNAITDAVIIMNPTMNMLNPATAPISGGPVTVELLGQNMGTITGTGMADNVPVPTVVQSGGWYDITLTPPATPGVVKVDTRHGHDHPEGHDNVRPSALNTMYPGLQSVDFTWT